MCPLMGDKFKEQVCPLMGDKFKELSVSSYGG